MDARGPAWDRYRWEMTHFVLFGEDGAVEQVGVGWLASCSWAVTPLRERCWSPASHCAIRVGKGGELGQGGPDRCFKILCA